MADFLLKTALTARFLVHGKNCHCIKHNKQRFLTMKCFICDPSRFNVATIIKVDANLEAKSWTLINYAAVAWHYLSRLRCHPAHATDHNNFNYRHAEHSSPYRNTGTLRWTPRVKYHLDFEHTMLQGRRLTAFATESLYEQGGTTV